MPFTAEQERFVLEAYFRNGERNVDGEWHYSTQLCIEEFSNRFPNHQFDYESLSRHVLRIVKRFRETGSVCRGKSPGRPTVLTEDVVENIRERLDQSPQKPLRQLSQQTGDYCALLKRDYTCSFSGLSYGSCHKAVRHKLHYHAYKVSVVPQLLPLDYNSRMEYCTWFNENLNNNDLLNLTFFSDEAWFHLSGFINSQNYRTWSSANPHIQHEAPLHPIKIGVWVALSRRRIIGPVFFEETVTAARYQQILGRFIDQLHDDELTRGYFQHDNASAHTARQTIQYLQQFYDDRIIGRNRWPPRSPDLTPLDFFLFGYLKTRIYHNQLHTLNELKEAISAAVEEITPQMLNNVFENMKRRVNACLDSNGGHIEHNL